jgi:hypothetical protein
MIVNHLPLAENADYIVNKAARDDMRGPALAGAVIHQLAVQQHMRVLILRLYDDRCASRHVARRIKHLLMFVLNRGPP